MITLYSIFQGFIKQTKLYIQSVLPKKVSELTNDVGYLTSHQDISGKQDKLTFDNTPTANSSNPVTSSGIKSALDEKLNVSGNASTATSAGTIVPFDKGMASAFRNVWFSDNTKNNKPVYNENIQYNPVTDVLKAGTFQGTLNGNASTADTCTGNSATADKLKTARTITLTGNATGNTIFDGSGNVSISTTVNTVNNQGEKTAIKNGTAEPAGLNLYEVYNNGYPTAYGNLISIGGLGGSELLAGWSGQWDTETSTAIEHLYYRNRRDSGTRWSDWNTIAFTSDINNYAPTKDGVGATGTWNIDITGTAVKATQDSNGKNISTTYIKDISSDGGILTVTKGDGTASSFTAINDTAAAHNGIYRGKDLTSYCDSGEMSKAIAAGTFHDIYPGDYIIKDVTINGTKYSNVHWIVMDLDYHLHCGWSSETTKHHIILMPEEALGTAQMNFSNVTTDGYLGSAMWKTTIPLYVTGISNAFGADHVLSHYELLTSAQSTSVASRVGAGWTGGSTNWTWTQVSVNLCNEPMVYGCTAFSSSGYDIGECNQQLSAFKLNHGLKCSKRYWWWLRAVASSANFCRCGGTGDAGTRNASYSSSVRPYFLYC